MVIRLGNDGTVTVTESGSVVYRRRGEQTMTAPGRGSYAETVEWVSSLTAGSAGVLFTSRKA